MNICLHIIIALILSPLTASCGQLANSATETLLFKEKCINPHDLVELAGLPFVGQEDQSFHINSSNSKGDVAGIAAFKNPNSEIGTYENIAWFWSAANGFHIIARQSDLLSAYGKDWKIPFQFNKLMINESGAVAGSFLIEQPYDYLNRRFNQYTWLWWSMDEGLCLNDLPSECQIVKGLNDEGFVLIEHNTSLDYRFFRIIFKNIHDQTYSQTFEISPMAAIPSTFKQQLKKMFCDFNYFNNDKKIILKLKWHPFSTEYFDNDLKIIGRGACEATFVRGVKMEVWDIQLGYEIDNGKIIFYVKKINNSTRPHNSPNLTFQEKEYIIHEEEISTIAEF